MADLESRDFFTDLAIAENPIPYFTALRARGPVQREPNRGVMMVTGYDAAMEVWSQPDKFSSCVSVTGPFPPIPFEAAGDDIPSRSATITISSPGRPISSPSTSPSIWPTGRC